MYIIRNRQDWFLCKFLCKSFTPPFVAHHGQKPMNAVPQPLPFQPLRPTELVSASQPGLSWLWHGYLTPGKVTALISPSKTGKTTLVSHLLARSAQGGPLAGRHVSRGRGLVVSEEATADWDTRCRQLGIGENVQFLCRPFQGARPTEAQWLALVGGLEALHRQEALDLVVLDPLVAGLEKWGRRVSRRPAHKESA
jgi:hypothetical protein